MPIEVKELIIKARIEEASKVTSEEIDLSQREQIFLKTCKKQRRNTNHHH